MPWDPDECRLGELHSLLGHSIHQREAEIKSQMQAVTGNSAVYVQVKAYTSTKHAWRWALSSSTEPCTLYERGKKQEKAFSSPVVPISLLSVLLPLLSNGDSRDHIFWLPKSLLSVTISLRCIHYERTNVHCQSMPEKKLYSFKAAGCDTKYWQVIKMLAGE